VVKFSCKDFFSLCFFNDLLASAFSEEVWVLGIVDVPPAKCVVISGDDPFVV